MAKGKAGVVETTIDEDKIIRLGEKAVDNLKRTFDHWMEIARALEVGRNACMRAAGVDPETERGEEGGGFSKLYSAWLNEHQKLKLSAAPSSQKMIRSWLHKCLEHEIEIRAWRKDKGIVELSRYSFPETVFKRWAKDTDFIDPNAKPKRPRKKKDEKQKQDETSLDYARQRIKNLVDEAGDWDNDTPEQIAEKLVTSQPVKAEEVAQIILGDEDRTNIGGLDWNAPDADLVEVLVALIPNTDKGARVLRAVLKRIEALVPA